MGSQGKKNQQEFSWVAETTTPASHLKPGFISGATVCSRTNRNASAAPSACNRQEGGWNTQCPVCSRVYLEMNLSTLSPSRNLMALQWILLQFSGCPRGPSSSWMYCSHRSTGKQICLFQTSQVCDEQIGRTKPNNKPGIIHLAAPFFEKWSN